MRYRGNGGFVGPALSSNTSYAPGVWGIPDFQQRLGAGTWPTDLTASLLADPNFEYNTLLMKAVGANTTQNYTFLDSSAGNYTVTRNGDVNQGAVSPHAYADGYWSAYFDGTADSLNTTIDSLNIRTAFCIEAFAFTASRSGYILFSASTTSSTGSNFYLNEFSGTVYLGDGVTNNVTFAATEIPLNTWYHIAVTFDGTTYRVFINGNLVGSSTSLLSNFNIIRMDIGIRTVGVTNYYNGYLSNFRVVKGSAVYTSTFTPSTAPLSAISGTSLLTCQSNRFKDNSTNAYTVTRNNDTKITTFGPFNPSIYSASATGGSFYFDGTGDFLTSSYSTSDFDWWTSDYTLEYWVYPVNLTSWSYNDGTRQRPVGVGNMANNSDVDYWSFGPTSEGTVRFYYFNGAAQVVTSSQAVNAGQWNHVAVTKTSSGITIFVNGVASTTTAVSGTPQSSSGTALTIGRHNNNAVNGYISNLRIVKGTAVYSGNFTPPTSPLTAISNTKYLLNATNAGIIDASRKNNVYTFGNAQVRTNIFKYDKSVYFDGTGDYLTLPSDNAYVFGTGNFTIECWIYVDPSTDNIGIGENDAVLLELRSSGATSTGFVFNIRTGASNFVLNMYTDGAANLGTTNLAYNTWHHVAITRSGSTVYLLANGAVDRSFTKSNNFTDSPTPTIGSSSLYTGSNLVGYVEDFRITKGLARYTSSYTLPSAALQTS